MSGWMAHEADEAGEAGRSCGGEVKYVASLIAVGVNEEGFREVLRGTGYL
jgi:hypothetical protein